MTENVIPIHNKHPNGTTSTAYYNFEEDPSFEKRHAHVRQALEQLYENSQPHSDDDDDDDDSQYLKSTLLSPVKATNVTMDSGNGNYHATVTFTEDEECNDIQSGSSNSSSAGFSLSDIDSSSSVSSLLSLREGDKERRSSDQEINLQTYSQDGHLNLKNKQYIPTTKRLVHPPNISFDTIGPDLLRQNLNNVSASLEPCANQTELEKMRRVAEQIKIESDEKVRHLEEINDRLNQQLLSLQRETRNNIHDGEDKSAYGDNNGGEAEEYWKNSFNTLVEHLCNLEETGAWRSHSIRIDKIILDSMNNHNHAIISSDEMIGDRLRRLSQSNRKKARKKSMSDDDLNQTVSSTLSRERFVSVSVHTDDLKTNRFQSTPFHMDEHQINQLLKENANLKESHEQLREQINDYQGQVQSLQGFKEQLLSPTSAIEICHDDDTLNAMKKTNAMLSLQNSMLADEKEVILEENIRLARRGAELERLAEDATMECERCFERLREVDAHLRSLEKSNEDLTAQIRKWKENYQLQETENLEIFDEMSKEIEDMKRGFEALETSKSIFQNEVESLKAEKISLQSKADESLIEIQNIKAAFACEKQSLMHEIDQAKSITNSSSMEIESLKDQMQTLENQSKQLIEDLASSRQSLEVMSNERDSLMKVKQTLSEKIASMENQVQSISKENIALQDECNHLRDTNEIMKSNIDERASHDAYIESEKDELQNRIIAMEKVLASSRTENVRLSDSKSDVELQLSHLEDEMRLLRDDKLQSESKKEELTKIIAQKDKQMNELRMKVDKLLSEKAKNDSEMNQFKKAVITYRDEVEKVKQHSDNERLTLQNAVETRLRELQSAKKELESAQTEKDMLQKSTMTYQQQVDALIHQNEKLSAEMNELKATVSKVDALSTENDIMKQKYIELQTSVEGYRTKIENLLNEMKRSELIIDNQQADIDELQSKLDNMVEQNTESKLQLDTLLKENEALSCQIEDLRSNLDSALKEVDNLVVSQKDVICEKELVEKDLSDLQSKVDDQATTIVCREEEIEVLTRDIEEKNELIEGLQKAISVYKDELGAVLIAKRRSLQDPSSGKTPISINTNVEKDANTEDFSKSHTSINTVTRTPLTELNLTVNAPSTAKSGLSTVKSSLFTVAEQPSTTNLYNDDPIDAMLERIQLMSQRTMRSHKALGDKSEKNCKPSICDNNQLEDDSSDGGETEAFVCGVLERVGYP